MYKFTYIHTFTNFTSDSHDFYMKVDSENIFCASSFFTYNSFLLSRVVSLSGGFTSQMHRFAVQNKH